MKQILQNFKTGELGIYEVPVPLLKPNGVLVRTHYSLISSGTEGGTVRLAKMSMVDKARSRPDLVKKVMNVVRTDGLLAAYSAVSSNLDAPVPLGYSTSGIVVEVGVNVTDLKVGDKVACFGSMVANHAEVNFIPRNLCVRVPDDMDLRLAAFSMLGAIALNGVRRAQVELGSTVLVIGLGLIGAITVQLLKASGCRVFGIDLDPAKVELALKAGCDAATLRSHDNVEEAIKAFSDGLGVDATIITAATPTNDPVALAGRVSRMRGRVVALGRVPYELPRDEYLFKEIDFVTTLAFGPGVNDPNYEQKGFDYPAAYVRWSGNRNVQTIMNLIADQRINLEALISHEFPLEQADEAFQLATGEKKEPSVAILLRYDVSKPYARPHISLTQRTESVTKGKLGIGVIGAGSHAVSFLLDAISAQNVELRGIVSAGGAKSQWYGSKYQFEYAASTPEELLADKTIDAVFILSRHDSHGPLTTAALHNNKHVFVEKPLCLTSAELDAIVTAQQASGCQVMVGYNRRYAPLGQALRDRFASRAQPLTVTYRMNAGFRPANHWLHDAESGGGLILGEAVHFIDFMQFLIGAAPKRVFTQSIHSPSRDVIDADNVMVNVQYADGSIGLMTYVSTGDKSFGRERIEVFSDNTLAVLEDWRSLVISKDGKRKKLGNPIKQDKGFVSEVAAFIQSVTSGAGSLRMR